MKIAIAIPAYNEGKTISQVIKGIPKKIKGISKIKVIVINDGSTDNTEKQARKCGAEVINFKLNKGLSFAFKKGLEAGINSGADIIINIDADNQYEPKEIPKLILPIMNKKADIVLGNRFNEWMEFMPLSKKIGNKIASKVTSLASGLKISDSQTGFRAFSREAALRLNIISNYTYTQETIIQAAHKKLKIVEIPIHFRKRKGKSRLVLNVFDYALRSGITILRTYRDYNPLKFFISIGAFIIVIGFVFGLRVLLNFIQTGLVRPYTPSAILSSFLLIIGFQVVIFGFLADMNRANKKLIEENLYRSKS